MRQGPDAELRQIAVVAEELVLKQDLVDYFLRTAHGEGAARLPHRVELRAGRGRPSTFTAKLGHHLGIGGKEFVGGLLRGVRDIGVGVDADLEVCRIVSGPAPCLTIK